MSINWTLVLNTGLGVAAGLFLHEIIKKLLAKIL